MFFFFDFSDDVEVFAADDGAEKIVLAGVEEYEFHGDAVGVGNFL